MDEITLEPEPGILIESLRDIGYSFNSALADIIDNSITANAESIWVMAIPTDDCRVAIVDDGDGLVRDDLVRAMRLGSSDPRQQRNLNTCFFFFVAPRAAAMSCVG